MKAVLYICHGSRVKEGCNQAIEFVRQTKTNVNIPIQEVCFLELAKPTIEEGVTRCVRQGATDMIAIPVFLLAAGHVKHDIPAELNRLRNKFPFVRIHYGQPFGVHEKIIDILLERMEEQLGEIQEDAAILLVGRGSSDPDTLRDFQKITQFFRYKTNFSDVNKCFLVAATPSFNQALTQALKRNSSQIIIVPYLLFSGLLMKRMKKTIQSLETSQEIILCNYLGYHPLLQQVLIERVQQVNETIEEVCISRFG
ncbi:sirohydrochlorin ferrochelatase [Oikeobacillus pervagus]|uniref:Sirohydrochlorin ferrochelatase n=1 Tax=Oikeobacillus pervagus TaxID=1325931 RepID=A0AAJ1SWH8_9BACI|nr:sirohydrochlorin chelatase [Oikeobacillus pervagus]MDQ0214030.1 sirohydrochlorin ferrochelatase [Oikeobacillus pervagus]